MNSVILELWVASNSGFLRENFVIFGLNVAQYLLKMKLGIHIVSKPRRVNYGERKTFAVLLDFYSEESRGKD